MSIPTRSKLLYEDGSSEVVSFGTVSYGSDTSNREFWLRFFKERFLHDFYQTRIDKYEEIVMIETMYTEPTFLFDVAELR